MAKSRRWSAAVMGLVLAVALVLQSGMTVQAGTNNYLDELRGGVAVVLEPGNQDVAEIVNATAQELNLDLSTARWHRMTPEPLSWRM